MENTLPALKYDSNGLIPVVVQDAKTNQVLMFAYANEDAVFLTVSTGFAHYFSRSRKKLWKKGEESGHLQKISEILVDCDCDTLLYKVEQTGCACHEGYRSCFFRNIKGETVLPLIKAPEEIYKSK
ncbi:MAG: phosphoribosyl-AMP cyclohydrolase [Methanocorpusculum sp.]|nr:phosphoribosyl-AMP cyclohydrolase [Methanocorpusculum sp.]